MRMSFAATQHQMRDRTKTVTRRGAGTWKSLKAGDEIVAVEKAQGLKKGDRQVIIGHIRVTAVYLERLADMPDDHPRREGFPEMTVADFVNFFCDVGAGALPDDDVRVIEFEHIDEPPKKSPEVAG